jgi:DNA-binding NarL/FixJ family response regulator
LQETAAEMAHEVLEFAVGRLYDAVVKARAKFGDDPLFDVMLNQAAQLASVMSQPTAVFGPMTNGWTELSRRECQVARLLSAGLNDRQIAVALGVSLTSIGG